MGTINELLKKLDNKVPASISKRLEGLITLQEKLSIAKAEHNENPTEDSKEKLEQILQMNATCDGAMAVKTQYDALLRARLLEIEKAIVPLLLNLQNNKEKDYIHWPGSTRYAQCELQINKIINLTRNNL